MYLINATTNEWEITVVHISDSDLRSVIVPPNTQWRIVGFEINGQLDNWMGEEYQFHTYDGDWQVRQEGFHTQVINGMTAALPFIALWVVIWAVMRGLAPRIDPS